MLAALLIASAIPHAEAQTVIDGSEKNVDNKIFAEMKKVALLQFVDPVSVQFAGLNNIQKTKKPGACGYVNARNRAGGYNGFRPFFFMSGSDKLVIQPENMPSSAEIETTYANLVAELGCPPPG